MKYYYKIIILILFIFTVNKFYYGAEEEIYEDISIKSENENKEEIIKDIVQESLEETKEEIKTEKKEKDTDKYVDITSEVKKEEKKEKKEKKKELTEVTSLIFMPTAYTAKSSSVKGVNLDFAFGYYLYHLWQKREDTQKEELGKSINYASLLGDIKYTFLENKKYTPAIAIGLLGNTSLGGSTSGRFEIGKKKDFFDYGYLVMSKKIKKTDLHLGTITGRTMGNWVNVLLEERDKVESNLGSFIGISSFLFSRPFKLEAMIIHHKKPYLLLTVGYFFNFSYFIFPSGKSIISYMNVRFTIYPTTKKKE